MAHGEGTYANGFVTVSPLPEAVHGQGAKHTVPLRRLEAALTPQQLADHEMKECAKLPSTLRLEPLKLVSGAPPKDPPLECLRHLF